jgi:hypothetical protein
MFSLLLLCPTLAQPPGKDSKAEVKGRVKGHLDGYGYVIRSTPSPLSVSLQGPDGERQVCRPCVERSAFRRLDEDEDGESLPNAGEF